MTDIADFALEMRDRIRELTAQRDEARAENARLREALVDLRAATQTWATQSDMRGYVYSRVRAALSGIPKGGTDG
jgi:hypothetical protein